MKTSSPFLKLTKHEHFLHFLEFFGARIFLDSFSSAKVLRGIIISLRDSIPLQHAQISSLHIREKWKSSSQDVTKKINGNFSEYLMNPREREIVSEIANFGIMQFSRVLLAVRKARRWEEQTFCLMSASDFLLSLHETDFCLHFSYRRLWEIFLVPLCVREDMNLPIAAVQSFRHISKKVKNPIFQRKSRLRMSRHDSTELANIPTSSFPFFNSTTIFFFNLNYFHFNRHVTLEFPSRHCLPTSNMIRFFSWVHSTKCGIVWWQPVIIKI